MVLDLFLSAYDTAVVDRALVATDSMAARWLRSVDTRACQSADLVLLDLRMPDLDGRATLEQICELPHPPPVIMVTADSQLRTAIDAVRAGASDFLAKPYDIEELRWVVERTLAVYREVL